jgi:hypothetical protein
LSTGDAPARLGTPRSRGELRLAAERASERLHALAAWRHADALALGFGVALITALNLLWVSLETRPPHWDKARHLTNSLVYRETFADGDLWGAITDFHTYPPLIYWAADLFYGVFQTTDAWAATLSQSVFLAVLTFSTYGLGRHLWSRRVGLLAAVFVVTSPMVVSQFKDFMVDAPLTAMTALALFLLVRSEEFSRRGASAALGAACGLGMLTKWNFALYFALPAVVAVARAARSAWATRVSARLVNVGLAAVIAVAIAGPWYASNLASALDDLSGNERAAEIEGDPPVASVAGISWYFWNLVSNQLYLLPFLLFAVGVVLLALRRDARERNLYPLLLVVGTYVAYTALVNKDDRYTEPMLAGVAVVATYWLDSLGAAVRRWAAAGVLAYGAVTFAAISFGIGFLPGDAFVHLGRSCPAWPYFVGPCPGTKLVSATQSIEPSGEVRMMRGIRVWSQRGYFNESPSGERWYQEEMFREAARSSPRRTLYLASSGFDFIWFNGFAAEYFSRKYGVTWVAAPEHAAFAAVWSRAGETIAAPVGFWEYRRHRLPDGGSLRFLARGAGAAEGPQAVAPARLAGLSRTLGHPVYWVGPRESRTLEVTESPTGNVVVRYLPVGARVGDPRPALSVATYPIDDAYSVTRDAAGSPGAVRVAIGGGGVAFYSPSAPTSVFLAYPGSRVQIEVFDPSPGRARALVASGAVRPAG